LPSGTYYVTVTDSNNCSIIVSRTIYQSVPYAYSVEGNFNLVCHGDQNGTINVIVDNADNFYILWENNTQLFTRENLAAGTYSFTLSDDNMCSISHSVEIIETDQIVVTSEISNVNCGQNYGGIITSTVGGVAPYTFLWSNGNETSVNLNLEIGQYFFSVTDLNGCQDIETFNVISNDSINTQIIILSNIDCYGNNNGVLKAASIDGIAPLSFLWSNEMTNSTISNLFAGEYFVTISDSWGCVGLASVIVENPDSLNALVSFENVKCNGDSNGRIEITPIGGIGDYNISWNNGENSNLLTNLSSGNYEFSITDGNNCTYSSAQIISEPLNLTYSLVEQKPLCGGGNNGSISAEALGGSFPYAYIWEYNGYRTDSKDIYSLSAGNYYLTITDNNNCKTTLTYFLAEPEKMDISSISLPPTCMGKDDGSFQIIVSGGTEPYKYVFNNNLYSNSNFSGQFPGLYVAMIIDSNNCSSEEFAISVPESETECINIPNAFTPNGDGVNDQWEIDNIYMFPSALVQVYNRWGQIVFETVSDESLWDGTFADGNLPTGTYVYNVVLNNGTQVKTGTVTLIR
jgi:gliding motility-associated-like protein